MAQRHLRSVSPRTQVGYMRYEIDVPGESIRYTRGSTLTFTEVAIFLVTPGCPPVIAAFPFPTPTRRIAFSNDDFPTLGIPTMSIREPVRLSTILAVSGAVSYLYAPVNVWLYIRTSGVFDYLLDIPLVVDVGE